MSLLLSSQREICHVKIDFSGDFSLNSAKEIFWRFHVVVKGRNLIGSLTMGIEKLKLFIALNVLGGFSVLLDITMDISHGKFISGKSTRTHYANFPR